MFPTLDGKQRTAVLARTEIDSGYPLDSTSDGWQRLNLAAAFSSKVTVSDSGAVIKVEPGRRAEVVVQHDPTIASVRVTAQPTVEVYHAGQEFDPAGLVVTARMSDGTERRLSADEYVLMGFNANATNGPQTITVAVRDERTMTASFTVTIPLSRLKCNTLYHWRLSRFPREEGVAPMSRVYSHIGEEERQVI
ncbi:bacterial Ig-like domain-containing protein, partial [Bifidobacterium mongoliense]|uniref:bacterial Ig-like domain-containing protein n=1 Tax=Bifidobacterium mongoliense TaxID=518643 RepID=UPI0030EBFAAC